MKKKDKYGETFDTNTLKNERILSNILSGFIIFIYLFIFVKLIFL